MPRITPAWLRQVADRHRAAAADAQEHLDSLPDDDPFRGIVKDGIDHENRMAQEYDKQAQTMEDQGIDGLGHDDDDGETPAGDGDQPPNNPAVQIGEAVAEVEAATAEVAETVADAGDPETAAALETEVAARLDLATEQVAAAADTVEVVAEQVEQATPPNTPEGEAATEAVAAAEEATEAVEVAEDAVAEVTRVPEVRPDSEHWYFKSRFRRRAR